MDPLIILSPPKLDPALFGWEKQHDVWQPFWTDLTHMCEDYANSYPVVAKCSVLGIANASHMAFCALLLLNTLFLLMIIQDSIFKTCVVFCFQLNFIHDYICWCRENVDVVIWTNWYYSNIENLYHSTWMLCLEL